MSTLARSRPSGSWRDGGVGQPSAGPLGPVTIPATGIALIGHPVSIAATRLELEQLSPSPIVAGEIHTAESPLAAMFGSAPLGTLGDLPLLVARHHLRAGIVCLPSQSADREAVVGEIQRAGLQVIVVPGIGDLVRDGRDRSGVAAAIGLPTSDALTSERLTVATPSVDLAELIGRTPYRMDRDAVSGVLRGKRVLITGAGGSIGSELAIVAAGFEPSLLVLMERSENALFEIDRQIGRRFPGVPRKAVLHDVVDAESTLRACEKLRPHAVFHAAAHKHVPLMEDHPAHAVTNNLFGTKSIADAAVACGAERFVMISSDKAVNPTSVMGATKRLAEMYVRALGQKAAQANGTRLSMVRFGNVLGSAASVLTIWNQQIAEGGPITLTDARMTRYFMTIPEAATLVIQSTTLDAGAGDSGGVGVYVLDMGQPVHIALLAVRFAKHHGLRPVIRFDCPAELAGVLNEEVGRPDGGSAIDLVCTGIRPGEKLHEELAYAAEQLRTTTHPGIRAWAGPGFEAELAAQMPQMISELHAARFSTDPSRVVAAIRNHVPEMHAASISPEQVVHPQVG